MIESTFCSSFGTGRLVMLFYRYMLPYFTAEAYSWADPENEDSGFKTGENSELFRFSRLFSTIRNGLSEYGMSTMILCYSRIMTMERNGK